MIKFFILFIALCSFGCVSDIQGQKYNKDQDCWGPFQSAGTGPLSGGCDQAFTIAKDKNQHIWMFRDSCIPDGFSTDVDRSNININPSNTCEK